MPSFLRNAARYRFERLVDTQIRDQFVSERENAQIFCDIDKTYLETEFESILSMIKIAFEKPEEKITVQGASSVLAALRWGDQSLALKNQGYPRGLHFVSSSPKQLRRTLEHKLALDGLDWSSDSFKNQSYNILKGRMDLLKKHVAYKTAAILNIVRDFPSGVEIFCIGDNAEADAVVYLGLALFLNGCFSPLEFSAYLRSVGIEKQISLDIVKAFKKPPACRMGGICIRKAPGYEWKSYPVIENVFNLFSDYFQLCLLFVQRGLMLPSLLPELCLVFHNQHLFSRQHLCSHLVGFLEQNPEHEELVQNCYKTLKIDAKDVSSFKNTQYQFAELSLLDSYASRDIMEMMQKWSRVGLIKGAVN